MADIGELVVRIRADAAQLERELKRATSAVDAGTRSWRQRFDSVGSAIRGMSIDVGGLSSVLAPIIGAASVSRLAQYSDAWTQFGNRLRVVTDSATELEAAQVRLFDIAQKTRTEIDANAQLYARLRIASKELGASEESLFRVTEAVGQAITISGSSAGTASGALLQFSQALGGGIVRAEEFNSIIEGAPRLAQAAAEGLDRAGGSVARLRTLIAAGTVTSREFFAAVLSQAPRLADEFGKTQVTIAQSFTLVDNAFTRFIGQSGDVNTAAGAIANSLALLAENMDEVGRIVLALAAVITTRLAIGFGIALTAINPWAAALTALIGTTVYLTTATDKLNDSMSRVSRVRPPTVNTATTGPEARRKINEALVARGLNPLPEDRPAARPALVAAEKEIVKTKNEHAQANVRIAETSAELNKSFSESARYMDDLKSRTTSALTDIAFGFDSAGDAVKGFAEQLARLAFERKIAAPLVDSFLGTTSSPGLLDSLLDGFGGFFADGGSPPVGRPSIVGERGPEVFVPRSAGTIVPNHALGGSQVIVQQTINLSPGLPETVNAAIMRAAPAIAAQAQTAVFQAIERGGTESRMVGRRN